MQCTSLIYILWIYFPFNEMSKERSVLLRWSKWNSVFFPLDSVWNILFSLKGKQKEQRVSGFNQAKKKSRFGLPSTYTWHILLKLWKHQRPWATAAVQTCWAAVLTLRSVLGNNGNVLPCVLQSCSRLLMSGTGQIHTVHLHTDQGQRQVTGVINVQSDESP